ncbi:MAG: NYN domain-containing protein [Candidatus Eremiobacterota bacterium]
MKKKQKKQHKNHNPRPRDRPQGRPRGPEPEVEAPPAEEPVPAPPGPSAPLAPPEPAPPEPRIEFTLPQAPLAPTGVQTVCFLDFENFFYSSHAHGRPVSIPKLTRVLQRLSREAVGDGFAFTAVYAGWDAISAKARHAQDEWAMMGWRTVTVPTKEDLVSQRAVKNMVDFVMSLDLLEAARDHPDWSHFFIASGDSDFCEVVERLKRLRRRVTVVALKPSLSYRLQAAADDYVVCNLEDVSGPEVLPTPYRILPGEPRRKGEQEPYQILREAISLAEQDQGTRPVPWRLVRDRFFLPSVRMNPEEADQFAREWAEAGFLDLASRKGADGRIQAYISIPKRG